MPIFSRRRLAALAAALAASACLAAAGCSPSPGSARTLKATPGDKVIQEAVAGTLAAPQFSFTGEMNSTASGQLGITFREKNGVCEDQYSVIDGYGRRTQGTTTVIVRGTTVWLAFDAGYLRAHMSRAEAESRIRSLHGRYLEYSAAASPEAEPDVQLCNLKQQWHGWPDGFRNAKGTLTTYRGQRVYQLKLGSEETIDVTDSTAPRLVSVQMATSETSRLDYDYDYGPVTLTVPPPGQSVPARG